MNKKILITLVILLGTLTLVGCTNNKIPSKVTLGKDKIITFKVPRGAGEYYESKEESWGKRYSFTSSSDKIKWFSIDYTYINYQSADQAYELNFNSVDSNDPILKAEKFTLKLNGEDVKCIDMKYSDSDTYYIYYPLSSSSYVEIYLTSTTKNQIKHNDIKKYVKKKGILF